MCPASDTVHPLFPASVVVATGGALNSSVQNDPNGMKLLYNTHIRGSNMSGSFPVTPGHVSVRMYFAEPYFNSSNSRVFTINAQGIDEAVDLDVVAVSGGYQVRREASHQGTSQVLRLSTSSPWKVLSLSTEHVVGVSDGYQVRQAG
jgi:Malectin domain